MAPRITAGRMPVTYVTAYDANLTKTTPSNLTVARSMLSAATVGDYALFGGGNFGTEYPTAGISNVVDAYDSTLTKTTPTVLSVARGQLSATTIGNYALFGGGYGENSIYSNVVDVYDSSLTRSTPTGLSVARSLLSATTVGNYALFGGGTVDGSSYSDTVDVYTVV